MKLRFFAQITPRAPRRDRFAVGMAAIAALALLFAACSRKDADSPLAYVPAQTPYVFANLEPTPDNVIESWSELLSPLRKAYEETLERARAELQKDGDSEESKKIVSILELFDDKLSIEGWERVGFSRKGRAAIYGIGVLPVVRIELGDPDALRGFVAELERRSGETFPVAEIDGHSYWRFTSEIQNLPTLVVAIIDKHLVLTLDPGPDIAPLADLLGLNRPSDTLLDSNELADLNKRYGYLPHGTLLIDSRRVVQALIGGEGQETWFTRKLAVEGTPLTPACRTEFVAMTDNMPRLVSGYTKLDAKTMDSSGVIELKPALAQALIPLAAPVPGLGRGDLDVAFDMGFSLKLDKLAEFIQAQASAIRAEPYACELLASFNEGAEQVGQQMAGLYMAAGWFTGMRAVLTELTFSEEGKPERAEGALIIASPNPSSLVGMLKGFVPQLADLDLVAGAEPTRIPLDEMDTGLEAADLPPTYAALTDSAIGLGFGAEAQTELKRYMGAASVEPAPLFYIGYQGAFYVRLMQQIEAVAKTQTSDSMDMDDDFDAETDTDVDLDIFDKDTETEDELFAEEFSIDDKSPKAIADSARMQHVFEPLLQSFNALYAGIDYTSVDMVATERGLEMRQVMRLK